MSMEGVRSDAKPPAPWRIYHGDCLEVLRTMSDRSVDAIVTDPPAGIAFMGAEWDKDKGGRDQWIAWLSSVFVELRRVAKPGAHSLVWALPRTSHWTGMAIENAGWMVRDRLSHLFATGFPKSVDLAKSADKRAGHWRGRAGPVTIAEQPSKGAEYERNEKGAPITAAAAALQGWGSALKPACEDWWLARAPLDGSLLDTVLAHGTGGLNVDGCRIGYASEADRDALANGVDAIRARGGSMENSWKNASDLSGANPASALGRWPANLVLSHTPECRAVGTREGVRSIIGTVSEPSGRAVRGFSPKENSRAEVAEVAEGAEGAEVYDCAPECPVKLLDEQSGLRPGMSGGGNHREDYAGGLFGAIDSPNTARGDIGGASRFFFTAKPSREERERGCDWMEPETVDDGRQAPSDNPRLRGSTLRRNIHPTVKSTALMRWLCRLITPRGGLVLDPFCGSGSTIVAALAEGFRAIGIEQDSRFVEIAKARIVGDAPLLNRSK
jgi:site-specific DNA-methyltransferase (adenine-specific)